jgi:hypothetical protein
LVGIQTSTYTGLRVLEELFVIGPVHEDKGYSRGTLLEKSVGERECHERLGFSAELGYVHDAERCQLDPYRSIWIRSPSLSGMKREREGKL